MALSREDKADVKAAFGKKAASAVSKATRDGSGYDKAFKKRIGAKKEKEPYFGLPHGEKDTPQLRKRFGNYVKKNKHTFGHLDKQNNYKLLRDNSFYEFNKSDYD